MKRYRRRMLAKMWGYALFAILIYGWFGAYFGPGILAMLSTAVILYCLFQAPVWCCAENRAAGQYCRNNANGHPARLSPTPAQMAEAGAGWRPREVRCSAWFWCW
jgi:hypothetical protein